jgi:hypothetical protein
MKISHKNLPHFFIIYYKFTSYEELVRTTVYIKSGLRIYTPDLNTFFFPLSLLQFSQQEVAADYIRF